MKSARQSRNQARRARHRAMWEAQAAEAAAKERETVAGFSAAAKLARRGSGKSLEVGGGDPLLSSAQRLKGILSVGPADVPYRTLGGGA